MVVIMLKSLPPAYEHFIETLNITATNFDLKFGELCNKLLQHDRWKKQFGSCESEGLEQLFAANVKGRGKWPKKKGQDNGEDASKSLKTIACHYCGNEGREEVLQKAVGRTKIQPRASTKGSCCIAHRGGK